MQATTESADLAQAFADAATAYVPDLKVTTLVVPLNGAIAPDLMRSDHAHFWLADIPALMLTDGANLRNPELSYPERYHRVAQFHFHVARCEGRHGHPY
jgi:hypothetical protein